MAGLVPAIHVFGPEKQDVDARHEAGHDGRRMRGLLKVGARLCKRASLPGVTSIALAFGAAFLFGLALVLTQFGLRDVPSLSGAAISIPASTLLFVCAAPIVLADATIVWGAVPIFAAVGLLFPGTVTLLTFAANHALGPVMTGALGNLAPLFAVALAVAFLGEPLHALQLAGLIVTVAGIVLLTAPRRDDARRRLSWYLLLPLAAAALRGITQATIKLGLEIWPSPLAAALIGYVVSTIVVLTAVRLRTGRFVAKAPARADEPGSDECHQRVHDISPRRRASPPLCLPTRYARASMKWPRWPLASLASAPRGLLWFAGVGWCNGIAALLMYAALSTGPVTLVSPLVATYPLVTVGLSLLMLRKIEISLRLALAVALTVAGVALLIAG
jgi:drug/metabolite transporter (DMT)-like permease